MSQFLCNFAMVETVLAHIHDIEIEHRSAFANRIKHMQRLGYPTGINTGRGIAATYKAHHLFLLGLTLELAQVGLATDSAIPLLKENSDSIRSALQRALRHRNNMDFDPVFLAFDPAKLSPLMKRDCRGPQSIRGKITYGGQGVLGKLAKERRCVIIALTKLLTQIGAQLATFDSDEEEQFYDGLRIWMDAPEEEEAS